MVLRNKKRGNDDLGSPYAVYRWIWNSLSNNKPYDQFVREIIAASGQWTESPGVVWFREVDQVTEQVEDTAQLFLGLRIQCARCHHHPFEKWSQNDYYGFSAFFSRVGKKNVTLPGFVRTARDRRIIHNPGAAFGLDLGSLHLHTFISIVALGLLIWLFRSLPADAGLSQLGLVMVVGGALGNIADRLLHDAGVVQVLPVRARLEQVADLSSWEWQKANARE